MIHIDVNKLKEKIYAEDTVSLAHGSLPEFDQGCHYAFLTVLSFIDSLQQEQQEVDVEKEIEDYAYSLPHSTTGSSAYVSDKRLPIARQFGIKHAWSFEYVMEIAMHSYELGLKAGKEE